MQARPLVEFPTHRPTRCTVAAVVEHHARRLGKSRSADGRNRRAGVQSEEVVHMPVVVVRIIDVFAPFLQLSVTSDLIRSQIGECIVPRCHLAVVYPENHRRLHRFLQVFANHRVGESRPFVNGAVFG